MPTATGSGNILSSLPGSRLESVDDLLYTLKMKAELSHGHKSLVVKEKQKGHETRA